MNMKFAAVELSDVELESVYGGDGLPAAVAPGLGGGIGAGPLGGGLLGGLGGGLGAASSLSSATSTRVHSFSVVCDINIFSVNAIVLPILNIADCTTQVCANDN
jgi:hypothetical protein